MGARRLTWALQKQEEPRNKVCWAPLKCLVGLHKLWDKNLKHPKLLWNTRDEQR